MPESHGREELPADNRDDRSPLADQALADSEGRCSTRRESARAIADRLMVGLDDRSRMVLEALDRRYDEGELTRLGASPRPRPHRGAGAARVGWTEFRGLRIGCAGDVLIPRPETEEVVGWFLNAMENRPSG